MQIQLTVEKMQKPKQNLTSENKPTEYLNVRLPHEEMKALKDYCQMSHRTQSDVIREMIRSLPTASHIWKPSKLL